MQADHVVTLLATLSTLPRLGGELQLAGAASVGLLITALVLGIRHGIDWDHIAAITDITSTTSAAEAATEHHELDHRAQPEHVHDHGGPSEESGHGTRRTEPGQFPEAHPAS